MKILVIGRGGREHAIVKTLSQSIYQPKIFVAPGNEGMKEWADIIDIDELDNQNLVAFAKKEKIDLSIVGPEAALMNGIADEFIKNKLTIFAPNSKAAIIEGSKEFAKQLMAKYQIPTAAYQAFDNFEKATDYLLKNPTHLVIKADGLAAGKGVVVAKNIQEAIQACDDFLNKNKLGNSGKKIVIEEFLEGMEFSLMAFVNGENVIPMELARDYKRTFDNDEGPNTGGMGAYSPVPEISSEKINFAIEQILIPTAKAMVKENRSFCGVLYAGLIDTGKEVKVIEFNARFGDPETEVLMPRLKSDLIDIILNLLNNKILPIEWSNEKSVGVVLASQGYPNQYQTHHPINGLSNLTTPVFHMGTKLYENQLVTNAGRVLFVVAQAENFVLARKKVYDEIAKIECTNLFYRKDIAKDL